MAKEQLSSETTLKVSRILQAPRKRVFRAWTDPKELARWFAPSTEYSTKVPELDLRVGGKYKVEMHHKGGNVHIVSGTYKEIRPPERIVFTWSWEGDPSASESLVTLEFLDLGPSTEIHLTHEQLPSAEERQKHEHGWNGCLAQLAAYVSGK
ncbi:MAG TPA: SRPBCC domain-containing protein [Candidatus Acidoferrales bacterium]|nr:SRPBCC domain-containing protein [Candidatus Acidoferrales bacterium]